MIHRNIRRLTHRSAFVLAAAVAAPGALALDQVFVDHFNNGVVENSDAVNGFWTQRNSGGTSAGSETAGTGPLQLTAGARSGQANLGSQSANVPVARIECRR